MWAEGWLGFSTFTEEIPKIWAVFLKYSACFFENLVWQSNLAGFKIDGLVNLAGSRINGVVGFKTSGYTVFLVFILCKKGKNMATIGKLCLRSTIHRNQLVLTSRLLATSASRMKKEGKILPNPFKSNLFYEEINSKIHTNINFVIIVYYCHSCESQ